MSPTQRERQIWDRQPCYFKGAGLFAFLALTASSCEHKPKGRFIDRVREYCGPDVAARYSQIPWVDRDYAADNLLITCVLFPTDVRSEMDVNKDQAGG